MGVEPIKIEKSKILIVEGKDEKLLFTALMENLAIETVQVIPIGGKTLLTKNLNALINMSEFDQVNSLGIIRDGDANRYRGYGVLKAVANVDHMISPSLVGQSPSDQAAIDRSLGCPIRFDFVTAFRARCTNAGD